MVPAQVTASLVRKPPRQHQRGQNLVELALVLPVFMLFLLGILDLGRLLYAADVVANCAREGARYGRVSPDDPAAIITVVENAAVGLDPTHLTATVSHPTETTLRVDVDYTFHLITPLIAGVLGQDAFVLHNAATMYLGY